jgi:hypothetical protein
MIGWSGRGAGMPYEMFDAEQTGLDPRRAHKLGNIYHVGQHKAWAGREVLAGLVERHGTPCLPEPQKTAIGRIFAIIMWGELAAWRVAAQLADGLVPLEAKMAATSQAHDEARHFYVMHEYLELADALPKRLNPGSERVLQGVLAQTNLAKKLLGMQLLVEPVALTLFQLVREMRIEPVLAELMPYYERDEARHVGLGVQYLPTMVRRMSFAEQVDLLAYQFRVSLWMMQSLSEIGSDLEVLGIHPRRMLDLAKGKQLRALQLLFDTMGMGSFHFKTRVLGHMIEPLVETWFPGPGEPNGWLRWAHRAGSALWKGTLAGDPGELEVA